MRSTTPTDAQTAADTAPSTISDFDSAPNGRHIFTTTAANPPQPLSDGGFLISERHGDIGWQMAVINNAPRVIWQRSWHVAGSRWRSWKRFTDTLLGERARAGELAALETRLKGEIAADRRAELDNSITAAQTARDAAITTAIEDLRAEITATIPAAGMDRDAVQALVDSEVADERQARDSAIAAATAAIASTRQARSMRRLPPPLPPNAPPPTPAPTRRSPASPAGSTRSPRILAPKPRPAPPPMPK